MPNTLHIDVASQLAKATVQDSVDCFTVALGRLEAQARKSHAVLNILRGVFLVIVSSIVLAGVVQYNAMRTAEQQKYLKLIDTVQQLQTEIIKRDARDSDGQSKVELFMRQLKQQGVVLDGTATINKRGG